MTRHTHTLALGERPGPFPNDDLDRCDMMMGVAPRPNPAPQPPPARLVRAPTAPATQPSARPGVIGPVVYAARVAGFQIKYRPGAGLFESGLEPRPRRFTQEIIAAVAKAFDVSPGDLLSECRFRQIAWPRQALYLLLKELTPYSLARLGRILGRDHTTLMYGIGAAERRCVENSDYAHAVEIARAALRGQEAAP